MSDRRKKTPEFVIRMEDYLAVPGEAAFEVQYMPGRFCELSVNAVDGDKELLRQAMVDIPNANRGVNWETIALQVTNGNGMLAKVLIALGDFLNVWDMHPSPSFPKLWQKSSALYPMVLAGSVRLRGKPHIPGMESLPERRVPKPSAGDLEETKPCPCCKQMMGPFFSTKHDLFEAEGEVCWQCFELGYDKSMTRDPRDNTKVASRHRLQLHSNPDRPLVRRDTNDGVEELSDDLVRPPTGVDDFLAGFN